MFSTRSARSLLEGRIRQISTHLQDVRDGSVEAIHAARVATRRSREALLIIAAEYDSDSLKETAEILQRAGRALGKARDADVVYDLLLGLDVRLPLLAPAVVNLRVAVARERQQTRRQAIKTLERLDLASLPQQLQRARRYAGSWRLTSPPWRTTLRDHLIGRSADLREAIHHGSGVYFPNRSHATRIALKKLRYAVELSEELRAWHTPKALRRLRRAQDTLGSIRDRQIVIERLNSGPAEGNIEPTIRLLDGEILTLHDTYVGMRDRLLSTCDRIDRAVRPRRWPAGAAVVALPSIILLGRHLGRGAPSDSGHDRPLVGSPSLGTQLPLR
jgi:CHAD domain-containing protein